MNTLEVMNLIEAQKIVFDGIAIGDVVWKINTFKTDIGVCPVCKGYAYLKDALDNEFMCYKCNGSGRHHDYISKPVKCTIIGCNLEYDSDLTNPLLEVLIYDGKNDFWHRSNSNELFWSKEHCIEECKIRNKK